MTLFNVLLNNTFLNQDFLFYGLFTGCVGVIGWSFFSYVLNRNISVQRFFEGITTSSVTDSTTIPRTFTFTHAQLSHIQNSSEQYIETLYSNSNQGLQAMLSPKLSADLSEIGTRDIQTSSIIKEVTDNSMQTLVQMAEKGVQTNPEMNIDLNSAMLDKIETFTPLFPLNLDLDLIEGYMPVSTSVIEIITTVTNNTPWL